MITRICYLPDGSHLLQYNIRNGILIIHEAESADGDFTNIYDQLAYVQHYEQHNLRDEFHIMHEKLCVERQLRPKVLVEIHVPPYTGSHKIEATMKLVETFS